MLKALSITASSIALFLTAFVTSVFAVDTPAPSATPVAIVEEANSFELFWPMVAGKTSQDSLYFLKTLKEKVRGIFIFGAPQKAEYAVFISTKRVLEAEKLLTDGKEDAAVKAIDAAIAQLAKAENQVTKAKEAKASLGGVAATMSTRLANTQKLAGWLATKYPSQQEKLNSLSEKAATLASSL